jgi:hypothetical protein
LHDQIVELARAAHRQHWRMSGDEGTGDRLAALVTATWQQAVMSLHDSRFGVEVPISPTLRERIDVVDFGSGTAYELKVSPNNAHFEFYRDIFKALVARGQAVPGLKKFVFLVPSAAAARLRRNMGGAVLKEGQRLGFELALEDL